ncbi:MAG: OmpA family protein [Cytophagales bacterium]|nr:OmpA family protein [Cytophagales bacterium]MDW8383209.1 OmpA family protein [Flammeovirgaceae bacterium]
MRVRLVAFFCMSFQILLAQTDIEKKGVELLLKHDIEGARKIFSEILAKDTASIIANYGMSKVLYEEVLLLKQKEATILKYKNLSEYFELLKKAYSLAARAEAFYKILHFEKRDQIRRVLQETEDGIRTQFMQTIISEHFNLITTAPYRKSTATLFQSQIYDRFKDAELVEDLREALLLQCADFLSFYPKSNHHYKVDQYRKELLSEYISKESLRQFGDRSGSRYERYCDLVINHFQPNEIAHILPEYYGLEYGFGKTNYQEKEEYKKLLRLAQSFHLSPLEFLCRLSLHYEGCTPANEKLYDALIRTFAPADIAFVAVQKMATPFINKENWKKASEIYERYKPLFANQTQKFNQILSIINSQQNTKKLINLGPNINSASKDYNPVISLDGNTLFFTRKNPETGEDIYIATKKNGQWQKAELLEGVINTRSHEVPLSISADGKTLVIYGNYAILPQFSHLLSKESKLGKGDIYFAEFFDGKWGTVDVFKYPINTPNYETGLSFTADKKAVLFSSDRKGAVGGYLPNYHPDYLYYHGAGEFNLDLYVCTRNSNGTWNEPINLGNVINTPFAEKNPILHPDGKTLYFSSDGHPGLGGYDIFMSKRLDTTWTNWSKPINLGKSINSPYDDVFYIEGSGRIALVVSNKEGNSFGDLDIYAIEIPEQFQPEPIGIVTGTVVDNYGKPITTEIHWEEDGNPKNSGRVYNNPNDGSFQFFVPVGKKYYYYASSDPYFSGSVEIDLKGNKTAQVIKDKPLTAISFSNDDKEHQPFIMRNLHFETNSDIIRAESFYDLNRMAQFLIKHPELKIGIEGHTDNVGNDEDNEDLSRRRAESVKKYLISKGVSSKNLIAVGYGEKRPIAPNDTEEGRQLNRRVEFKVLD